MKALRLGILGSTRGTDMLPMIAAIKEKKLQASIEVVVSNKADAMILSRATEHGIPTKFVDPTQFSREAFDAQLSRILHAHQVALVVLIGYMRILSPQFVAEWRDKAINIHPSLLPAFASSMDKSVHQAVLDAGISVTGCTVHYVTEEVDKGAILIQKECEVLKQDTAESLKERVQALEGVALIEAINLLAMESKKV